MVTRRAFLKSGALAMFAICFGGSPLFLGRTARAASLPAAFKRRKTLVAIFQRGAMDGLMAVQPFTDRSFESMRPRLGMTAARSAGDAALIDLDERFGLHPAFGELLPLYREGRLAIVHGVGSPDPTRSHFDAQDYMELGTPGVKSTTSGWLNRAVGLTGHDLSPFAACSMTPELPLSLHGPEPALAIDNLDDFGVKLPANQTSAAETAGAAFESLYGGSSQQLLRTTGGESFEAVKLLSEANLDHSTPAQGAAYPRSPLGQSLRQIAMLIKAGVGLEVAFAETGGWDTHVAEGTTDGVFARRARDLAGSVSAFWTDLGQYRDDVVLMTMTEFGRTVHENVSGGTDHGRASCLFVLGNTVDGGKVHGTVPAIVPEELEDRRDLPVTTDFRSVFAEIAGTHLGISNDNEMFPGWSGARARLMRSREKS